jgi:hypothetical protein
MVERARTEVDTTPIDLHLAFSAAHILANADRQHLFDTAGTFYECTPFSAIGLTWSQDFLYFKQ